MAKRSKEKSEGVEVPANAPQSPKTTAPEETPPPAPRPTVGGRYIVDGKLVNANGEEIKE